LEILNLFKIPLAYPDKVLIGARVTSIEEDRFMMGYGVFSTSHQKVAAEGDGLIVTIDYRESRKMSVPEELKRKYSILKVRLCSPRLWP
jgi:acyl-CoA thioester hydrolase